VLVRSNRLKNLLYRIIGGFYQFTDAGRMHPVRERSRRALMRSVDYVDQHMADAIGLANPRQIIELALASAPPQGHCMEFGVFAGGTIRFIGKRLSDRTVHGFDSFEGLPEPWAGYSFGRRAFDTKGRLPRVPSNVRLHRGWFEDVLPEWLRTHSGPAAFMHIDCDLYSSTRTVLKLLGDRIVPGTIILFDEYFNYPNWEQHEFKAFQEFVAERAIKYRYLAFSRQQALVRIETVGATIAKSEA
jgi:hypothetical protein